MHHPWPEPWAKHGIQRSARHGTQHRALAALLCGMLGGLVAGAAWAGTPSPLPWVARPHPKPEPPRVLKVHPRVPAGPNDIVGEATALSGERVMIAGRIFRLWGIAAPAMDEFGGATAKAGLFGLIADQTVVCTPSGEVIDGTAVARCHIGERDLSADLVSAGLARDCPRQSGGTYAALERQAIVDVAGGFTLPPHCVADF